MSDREYLAAKLDQLRADRTMPDDARRVGAFLIMWRAKHPRGRLPSEEDVAITLGMHPTTMGLVTYHLNRGGYLD